MKTGLIVATYNAGRKLTETLATFGADKNYIFTHSDHVSTLAAVKECEETMNCKVFDYRLNRGLSKSWNEGIKEASKECDMIVISNDDILYDIDDRKKMEESFNPEIAVTKMMGYNDYEKEQYNEQGYSSFIINPIAFETIGWFDENFYPAYHEDRDYSYRLQLAGLKEIILDGTLMVHLKSSTRKDPDFQPPFFWQLFDANEFYYIRKWGDRPTKEVYLTPFNNPNLDYTIFNCENPYGFLYDRDRG